MLDMKTWQEGFDVALAYITGKINDWTNPYPKNTLPHNSWEKGLNEGFEKET